MRRLSRAVLLALAFTTSSARADDLCPRPAPLLADATLVVRGFTTPPGDDSFRLRARLGAPADADPARDGFAFRLSGFFGPIAEGTITGGAGWRSRPRGGWSYHDRAGAAGGITRLAITPRGDGLLDLRVDGRRRDYAASPDVEPLRIEVAFAAVPAPNLCAATFFAAARCLFTADENVLRCVPRPQPRRCPDDLAGQRRCDALNVAAAQEAYYAIFGTYFSGACAELPGFTPSIGILCSMVGNDVLFGVVTVAFGLDGACVYESSVARGEPNLTCS